MASINYTKNEKPIYLISALTIFIYIAYFFTQTNVAGIKTRKRLDTYVHKEEFRFLIIGARALCH